MILELAELNKKVDNLLLQLGEKSKKKKKYEEDKKAEDKELVEDEDEEDDDKELAEDEEDCGENLAEENTAEEKMSTMRSLATKTDKKFSEFDSRMNELEKLAQKFVAYLEKQ